MECRVKKENNRKVLDLFLSGVTIIPLFHVIDLYAKEKAKLKETGLLIDDFYLLIGVTAVANNLILVTNNTKHFKRINNIVLEDWIKVT